MAFRIMRAHPEIRLGVQAKHAAAQQFARAQKHVLLETLHVDLNEIGLRNQAFDQQTVQPPDWYLAGLLGIFHIKPANSLSKHRAGSRIGRVEIKLLLAVDIAYRHAVIVAFGPVMILFGQLAYYLLDGVEAVHDEMIPQRLPALVLAALYANIDQDKWFAQKPLAYHPPREVGLLIERKIHFARLSSCRQPRGRHACILDASIPICPSTPS